MIKAANRLNTVQEYYFSKKLREVRTLLTQGKPIINTWESLSEVPAKTELAEELARDLKKLGFKFVGATVIYAHMQATGMVNDHLISCPSYGLTGT